MDLLVIGEGNCYSIVCVGHIHVMMESALYTTSRCPWFPEAAFRLQVLSAEMTLPRHFGSKMGAWSPIYIPFSLR